MYLGETVDGLGSEKARIEQRIVTDGAEQVVLFLSMERRLTNHHLVQQNAQSPPVYRLVVLLECQNLYKHPGSSSRGRHCGTVTGPRPSKGALYLRNSFQRFSVAAPVFGMRGFYEYSYKYYAKKQKHGLPYL